MKAGYSCAIATFNIEGWKPEDIATALFDKNKIHTSGINQEEVHGVRITPHVYTSLRDLDSLVEGIEEIAETEPPVSK
jgi:selenocysteine lyase/cysteine desulfurase